MGESKHELLLIIFALAVVVTVMLFSIAASPKYNELEASLIVTTGIVESTTMTAFDPNQPVNINTADINELMHLEGIGESKARDIVNYRKANGKFGSPEDIMLVYGIGEEIYNKNIDRITV